MKSYRGFTLLELLIAITIFSIVAIAIYSSFNVGIHAWRKAENSYKVRQEARHALNTIGRELRCAINFAPIAFEGTSNSVSFCRTGTFKITYAIVKEEKEEKQKGKEVETYSLYRILQTYQESVKGEKGTESLLASGVLDFKLQYAYLDLDKVVWKDEWKKEELNIPLGVKASLFYPSQGEGQVAEYSEAIFIPTGILKEATEGT